MATALQVPTDFRRVMLRRRYRMLGVFNLT
jgi:hypothetical protein